MEHREAFHPPEYMQSLGDQVVRDPVNKPLQGKGGLTHPHNAHYKWGHRRGGLRVHRQQAQAWVCVGRPCWSEDAGLLAPNKGAGHDNTHLTSSKVFSRANHFF